MITYISQSTLDETTVEWGVKVERVEVAFYLSIIKDADFDQSSSIIMMKIINHFHHQVKDVRVPAQLMRAMAAEAEAAREARAKVILLMIMTMIMLMTEMMILIMTEMMMMARAKVIMNMMMTMIMTAMIMMGTAPDHDDDVHGKDANYDDHEKTKSS